MRLNYRKGRKMGVSVNEVDTEQIGEGRYNLSIVGLQKLGGKRTSRLGWFTNRFVPTYPTTISNFSDHYQADRITGGNCQRRTI